MFRMFIKAIPKQLTLFPRGVHTDELYVGPVTEPIEQPGVGRRAPGCLFTFYPLANIKVVQNLVPVVSLFGFIRIVVAYARIYGHTIDDVAVRLIKSEVPVVILIPLAADRQSENPVRRVYVVASRQYEANVV